ncbi:hypothetical protein Tco_1020885 [Tanacetum coccineum]
MANVNAPVKQAHAVAPPTRTDEQILPGIRWVPIGKSNYYLDAEKSQSNPIYKIAVDILKHTNFFRAFTASSTIPAIYIQQFWDTICYDRTDGGYKCQLDEQWFNLTKDTLRDALQIMPVNNNKAFSSPPTQDTLINFVNDLGYPKEVKHLSNVISSGEEVSDPDSPTPKPAKSTKPKVTKQAKPVAPKAATKKPQPAPTKPKEKKRKQAKETTEATPPAKRAKAGKVAKKRTLKRSQQLVDEFVDEGIPLTEPGFGDLEADTQRAIEESLKDAHGAPRGPLPPVVFRETDTGKFQPLPEVEGKGKEKVGAEQAAQVLLNLQTPKKKSPAEQYIFQRRTSAPTEPSGHDESSSLYVELGLTESDTESDEEMPPVVKSGDQDEGQAGPDPGIQDKGQAEPNPDDVAESQPLSTPGVHAGPNLEHTDAEATDATSQPQPGQMDEEFTTTAYPNVQENLKLTVDEPVIPEEPASSTGTLSSLQHLAKDFSFGDQFFNDKPSEADNEKTTADTEAESMVSVTIHQDTSAIPPMTSPVIDLVSRPDSPNVHQPLPTTTTATATTTTTIMTTIPLPPQPQQVSSDSILINRLGELEQHIADLVDANQALEERLDKHGSRLYKLENQDIPNQVSKAVDKIVMDAVDWAMQAPLRERFRDLPEADMKEILHNRIDQLLSDLAEARKKKKKRQGSPKTPPGSPPYPPPPAGPSGTSGAFGTSGSSQSPSPPPPPSNNSGRQSTSTAASSSSKTAALAEYTAWMTTDTRLKPFVSPIPKELHMNDDTTANEQAYLSSSEDVGRDHIPTVNLRQKNGNSFKPAAQTTTNADGSSTTLIPGPVTADEKTQKKNDVKARSMLLMALPNEHLLTFNQYKDAKTLFAAIQTRFGGNDATKKTQKTLLKQMYENFSAPSTESLDSIFNRLQKIVSQLAILGENISQEDLNLKFLRSLPSEWNTHVVVWRNKPDLDTMSFDDLYNNFKIVEQEVKGTASSSSSSQNLAFVSSTSSTNEVNTAYGVSTANTQVSTASTQVSTANLSDDTVYAFLASQPNGSHLVHEDLEQIHEDDLEEMDLKWQLALLSMRTRKFFQLIITKKRDV